MDILSLLSLLISPITALFGWLAGSRQRKNTAIQSLQETIRMQSETLETYNAKIISLMQEIQEVRRENAELKSGQEQMLIQINELKEENSQLNDLIRANGLKKVKPKTIENDSPKK